MPSRAGAPITQDWEPIVIHKHKQKQREKGQGKESGVNAAIRAGAQVERIKKFDGGQNKASKFSVNVRKVEAETEAYSLGKVCADVRHAIQKARLDRKLTQAEVAKAINERAQVVQDYENGKAIPNQAVLSKLEKALGVKLRGKARPNSLPSK
eukprot:Gb_25033 [translate_table: standard]